MLWIYVEEASQKPMKQKNHWVYVCVPLLMKFCTQFVLQSRENCNARYLYLSSVETKYIIICIWWGDFNCWNSKCKMINSLSQICISSKKSVSLAQFANRTQNSPLITKWFEKIMSYVLNFLFFFALWFSSNEKYNSNLWSELNWKWNLSFKCVTLRRVRIVNAYCSFPLYRL